MPISSILVTGGAGFIGSAVVIAIGRPRLDLEKRGNAAQLIGDLRPDVVINAAAFTAVDKAEDEPSAAFTVNAEAAGEIAVAAKKHGAPIIQLSTDYVFDGRLEGPYE